MPASRDDDVYQAKLAEQAERYEGKKNPKFYLILFYLSHNRNG
jgi:hypothetical protein